MKNHLTLLWLGLMLSLAFALFSCKKNIVSPQYLRTTAEAYVIGFDPCAGSAGLVLAFPSSSDTVATYSLPSGVYNFPSTLFQGNLNNFLFPPSERKKYKVSVEYYPTPTSEQVQVPCQANINLADFNGATKKRQISIVAAQQAK